MRKDSTQRLLNFRSVSKQVHTISRHPGEGRDPARTNNVAKRLLFYQVLGPGLRRDDELLGLTIQPITHLRIFAPSRETYFLMRGRLAKRSSRHQPPSQPQ